MKIKPMGDRILVKIIKIEQYKGLYIADKAIAAMQGAAATGEVVGLGQGYISEKKTRDGKTMWDSLETNIGEKIIFNSRAGLALSKEYRLIHENEIIAKVADDGINIGDELFIGDES